MKLSDFKAVLEEESLVKQIENLRLLRNPSVITASVQIGASNQLALNEMNRLDTNTLVVVDRHDKYVGVINQDEIVRKVLSRVLREA